MLDSRPRGREFEPHRRHCVVSLSKNINPSLVLVQPRKTRPFITERLLMGRKESNQTNKQEGNVIWHKTLRMLKFHPITAFMKTYIYKLQKIFLIRVFWLKYIFQIKFKIPILDLMLLPKNSVPFEQAKNRFNKMKTLKIFLSETRRPRALIFGMQHHIVTLYQICTNYAPGAKNGPAPGVTGSTLAYIGKT